jgi:NitT/TauT family transport system substrate-binding protein
LDSHASRCISKRYQGHGGADASSSARRRSRRWFVDGCRFFSGSCSHPDGALVREFQRTDGRRALVAEDRGFFRKQGLDARLVYVRTGSVALSALAAGESHFYFGSGTGATLGAIAGGLDGVFVAGLVNRLTGAFVVSPQIKTPADLKGKNIGVQSIGGGIWMITMLALDHWGLDPKRDRLNPRIVGDEAVLAQSLAGNIIDGSYFGYTFAAIMQKQGFHVLADLANLKIPYQSTGILVRRSFLNSSPETVEKVVRAMVQAIAFTRRNSRRGAQGGAEARGGYRRSRARGRRDFRSP